MPLTSKQTQVLHLIKRSEADSGGWYRVSKLIWPLIDGVLPTDLAETKGTGDGGFIRFTDRGQAVADYA